MNIKLTKRAERRIEIVDQYWRANRPEAPDLLKQELSSARLLLVQDAYIGGACMIGGRHLELPLAVVHKTRRGPCEVSGDEVSGDVRGRRPVIVDDMISTGATIAAALDAVIAAGAAPDAIVAATHGVFAPGCSAQLAAKPIRRLLVTDSVEPLASCHQLIVERISLANLIVDAISRLTNYGSLDDLLTRT